MFVGIGQYRLTKFISSIATNQRYDVAFEWHTFENICESQFTKFVQLQLGIFDNEDRVLAPAADREDLLVLEMLPRHPERVPHVLLLPSTQLPVGPEAPGQAVPGLCHCVTHGGAARHLDKIEMVGL